MPLGLESNGFRASDITLCPSSLLLSAWRLHSLKKNVRRDWKHGQKQQWAALLICLPDRKGSISPVGWLEKEQERTLSWPGYRRVKGSESGEKECSDQ